MIPVRDIAMSQKQSKKKKKSVKMPSGEMNLSTTPNFFLTFMDTELVLSST